MIYTNTTDLLLSPLHCEGTQYQYTKNGYDCFITHNKLINKKIKYRLDIKTKTTIIIYIKDI